MPATLEDCLGLILCYHSKQKDQTSLINKLSGFQSNHKIGVTSNYESELEGCPLLVKAVLKYCLSPALNGHVFNKAMIFMAGQSGAGKSSTINRMFNDDNLCPTSDRRSTTKDVVEIEKEVKFFDRDLNAWIKSSLTFIDVPGNMFTEVSREHVNYATVERYLRCSQDLAERQGDYASLVRQKLGDEKSTNITDTDIQKLADAVEKHIRPSLVLLCVKSTDRRIEGTDSTFSQTLRNLYSLGVVDTKHLNLIVVVTCAMMIPKKMYATKTDRLREMIKEAFSAVFGVATFPLPIVFVENKPHEYDDVKMDNGFLELHDGEHSHLNLIRVMEKVFMRNKNALGMGLCGRYFSDYCEEQQIKPKITVMSKLFSIHGATAGATSGASAVRHIAAPSEPYPGANAGATAEKPDVLPTCYIGHGFCPITETIKADTMLMPKEILKMVRVLGRERWISQRIDVFDEQSNSFEQITQPTKEEYETKKKSEYGLDASISLALSVSPQGKWVKRSKGWSDTSTISFRYVMQMVSAQITEIKDAVKPELMDLIQSLPLEYSSTTADSFNMFFSKWGTHFVWRVAYGGGIAADCWLDTSRYSSKDVQKINEELQCAFSALLEKPKYRVSNRLTEKKSTSNTLSYTTLRIYGGRPPHVTLLESLTPEMLSEWKASLKQNCSELEHTIKLYPYYDLAQGKQSKSLKDATLAYLEAGKKREEQSAKMVQDASSWWRGWSCQIL